MNTNLNNIDPILFRLKVCQQHIFKLSTLALCSWYFPRRHKNVMALLINCEPVSQFKNKTTSSSTDVYLVQLA